MAVSADYTVGIAVAAKGEDYETPSKTAKSFFTFPSASVWDDYGGDILFRNFEHEISYTNRMLALLSEQLDKYMPEDFLESEEQFDVYIHRRQFRLLTSTVCKRHALIVIF